MPEPDEEFDHEVTPLTTGDLRRALEGVPDDMPVKVYPAEEPGGDTPADEQVIVGAAPWVSGDAWPRGCRVTHDEMEALLERGDIRPDHVEISLEFPSGRYIRRKQ